MIEDIRNSVIAENKGTGKIETNIFHNFKRAKRVITLMNNEQKEWQNQIRQINYN